MTDASLSPIDEVRSVLLGGRDSEVANLQARVDELTETVRQLEQLIVELNDRADSVGEVLVDAVAKPQESPGELGSALRPEIELAVHESARTDSVVLAEALYPVLGPAIRRMIAAMFTIDRNNPGETFIVEQVLLIERESGVLLAAVHRNPADAENSDMVSGMLDAIRLFVQDAFETDEHDGLTDLRVGQTSVLVEWGPKAVLASVVNGIPTDEYRASAALTLERLHVTHARPLENFVGDISAFDDSLDTLGQLRAQGEPPKSRRGWYAAAVMVALIVIIVLLIMALS